MLENYNMDKKTKNLSTNLVVLIIILFIFWMWQGLLITLVVIFIILVGALIYHIHRKYKEVKKNDRRN